MSVPVAATACSFSATARRYAGFAHGLETDTGGKGWFGTVQVGCDYQFSQRWLVGVFGDYNFSTSRATCSRPAIAGGFGVVGSERLSSSWASVRASAT